VLWRARETDPKKLAALGDDRLHCTQKQLIEALTGTPQPIRTRATARPLSGPIRHCLTEQIGKLDSMIAEAMKPHEDAVVRVGGGGRFRSGLGTASHCGGGKLTRARSHAAHLAASGWGPARDGSNLPDENHSSRSAKGNKYLRRISTSALTRR